MSRSLRVVLSTFGWWAVVALPSALTLAGALGPVNADNNIGRFVLLWIVGFVAQLSMVYVMEKALGHSRMSWFWIASLLPWFVYWSAIAGPAWGLLFIGIAGLVAVGIVLRSFRTIRLDQHGTVVDATVKKVLRNYMNVVINGVYIYRHLLLDLPATGDLPAREIKHWMLYEIGNAPSPGEHIKLRVDPRHPRHFEVDKSEFDDN